MFDKNGLMDIKRWKTILQFEPSIEERFRNDIFEKSLFDVRVGLWLEIILYALFGVLDIWIVPETKIVIWIIRFIIVIPFVLLIFIFTYSKAFKRYMQFVLSVNGIVVGYGIIAMIMFSKTTEFGFQSYYAGLILATMAYYTVFRLRYTYATITSLIVLLGYEVVAIGIQGLLTGPRGIPVFINNNFFFISSLIIGNIAGLTLEIYMRKDFLQRIEIEKSKELVSQSEARYKDLFENADDPMCTFDPRGYFQTINNAGVKFLGEAREEIVGSHISRWLTPESQEVAIRRIEKHAAGLPVEETVIYEFICKCGHKWVEVKTRPTKDGPRITGIHAVARDITEKKKLEQKLKESETKYRDLFERADDPMYTMDIKGYFQTINNAGLELLGVTKDEIIGTHISKWIASESLIIYLDVMRRQLSFLSCEQPITVDVVRKNGEHKWSDIRTRIIREGTVITGIHGIARDITEKKRLEQQLKESNEKLKKLDMLKSDFISLVSHELKTPLSAIRTSAEFLESEDTIDTDVENEILNNIIVNVDRLTRLINDILDLSKIEAGKMEFHFEKVNVQEIIKVAIENFKYLALKGGVAISMDISEVLSHVFVFADRDKLIIVLNNLISNALKFTNNGGRVLLSAKEQKDDIEIRIKDTGIGIDKDKVSKIFDKFYQVDSSIRRKTGGSGLGLTISNGIIKAHGSEIRVESEPGKGSIFCFRLKKYVERI